MCSVAGKRRTSDLNIIGVRPPLTTRHTIMLCVVGDQ